MFIDSDEENNKVFGAANNANNNNSNINKPKGPRKFDFTQLLNAERPNLDEEDEEFKSNVPKPNNNAASTIEKKVNFADDTETPTPITRRDTMAAAVVNAALNRRKTDAPIRKLDKFFNDASDEENDPFERARQFGS